MRDHDKSISVAPHKTTLLTRQQVRGLPSDRQIVVVKGCEKAFLPYKLVWYTHPLFRDRGSNIRGGAENPGQQQWVLELHHQRAQAARKTDAQVRQNAPSVSEKDEPSLKFIAVRTGWDMTTISKHVFGGTVVRQTVSQWLTGSKVIPPSRLDEISDMCEKIRAMGNADAATVAANLVSGSKVIECLSH